VAAFGRSGAVLPLADPSAIQPTQTGVIRATRFTDSNREVM
jgi:hypothetical protein